MTSLHVPEQIYARVTEYYDEKMKIPFVSDRAMYKYFNKSIKIQFCAHQMKKPIDKFMKNLSEKLCKITKTKVEIGHVRLINAMSTVAQTHFYLPDQTIIRQDALPDGFYFIIEGDCLVYQESEGDFKDYDYFEEKRILQDPEGDAEDESELNSPMKTNGSAYGDDSFGAPLSPQKRRLSRANSALEEHESNFMPAPLVDNSTKKVSFFDMKKMQSPDAFSEVEMAELDFPTQDHGGRKGKAT